MTNQQCHQVSFQALLLMELQAIYWTPYASPPDKAVLPGQSPKVFCSLFE